MPHISRGICTETFDEDRWVCEIFCSVFFFVPLCLWIRIKSLKLILISIMPFVSWCQGPLLCTDSTKETHLVFILRATKRQMSRNVIHCCYRLNMSIMSSPCKQTQYFPSLHKVLCLNVALTLDCMCVLHIV